MRWLGILFLVWLLNGCATSSPLFRERSRTGLPREGKTFGGTLVDADGDERLDVFLSRHARTPQIFRNVGHLRFRECRPAGGEWPALVDQHGSAAMDVDEDGDGDVYVTVGAGQGTTEGLNGLWRAVGRCTFEAETDVPHFLRDPRGRGRGALWLDLAADTRPDLLVFNEDTPARLFTREPDGWRDRTGELPPSTPQDPSQDGQAERDALHTACTGDLDGDDRPELFVAGTRNLLLGTGPLGELQDVGESCGLEVDDTPVADAEMADLDRDGDLDLVVAYRGDAGIRVWLNVSEDGPLRLAPAPPTDLDRLRPWSIVLEDLDNDGIVDLYVARCGPDQTNLPNLIARGAGDGTFTPQPRWGAEADVFSGSTGAWAADFDHDGDLDLLALQGAGPSPTQPGGVLLYENRTRHAGITLDLVPARGPVLGAKATLRSAETAGTAWARTVAAPWNSTLPRLHFGVGDASGPFEVEIVWRDGQRQSVTLERARAAYRIRQGEARPKRLR